MSTNQPHTRSRTNLFLSYRDSAIRPTSTTSTSSTPYLGGYSQQDEDDLENATLLGGYESRRGSTWSIVNSNSNSTRPTTSELPPKWVDLADQVDDILSRVRPKISQLDKLHAKHLLPGFKDRSAEEREIESIATSITTDFRSCQTLIRRIAEQSKQLLSQQDSHSHQFPPSSSSSTTIQSQESKRLNLLMAANVQTALATKVQELSTSFRKKQSEYLRRLQKSGNNESSSLGSSMNGGGGGFSTSSFDPLASLAEDEQYSRSVLTKSPPPSLAQQQLFNSSSSSSQQQQQQQLSLSTSTSTIDQRTSEINSIAQSITELSDLFKDLNSLVIDQGTLLDRIDYNVEQMSIDVKSAVEELKVATRYQRRTGKCRVIFLLVLAVVGCLIVIAFRPERTKSSTTTTTTTMMESGRVEVGGIGGPTAEEVAQKLTEELDGKRGRNRNRSKRRKKRIVRSERPDRLHEEEDMVVGRIAG